MIGEHPEAHSILSLMPTRPLSTGKSARTDQSWDWSEAPGSWLWEYSNTEHQNLILYTKLKHATKRRLILESPVSSGDPPESIGTRMSPWAHKAEHLLRHYQNQLPKAPANRYGCMKFTNRLVVQTKKFFLSLNKKQKNGGQPFVYYSVRLRKLWTSAENY